MKSWPIRNFGKIGDAVDIPDLMEIQQSSYNRFLQKDVAPEERDRAGFEALLSEIFPIVSYDKNTQLEYIAYELEAPRYTPAQCRELRLTYGNPLKIRCCLKRKNADDIAEQAIYLGEMPVMIGGGEFIINGAERVIVNQLHRSPGVDFGTDSKETGDRVMHGCRIIPERGSWIELAVTRKDNLVVRIDQSSKIPATTFLRATSEDMGSTEQIIRLFYDTKQVKTNKLDPTMWSVGPIVDTDTGEVLVEAGCQIGDRVAEIQASSLGSIEVITKVVDPLILNTIGQDDCESHEEALLKLYVRLRPGNPANIDKAKTLFSEKFYDENRYRLGRVGRFRINRKFNQNLDEKEMTLRPEDFLNTMKYIVTLRNNQGSIDDIDHLGNRRLRTIDELAADEIRKGLLKLRRTVQERMSMKSPEDVTRIADLVNSKSVSSSIDYFFGRGELSQVVDQTNALSQLTHERRLSALGPGGLNRKRAGFEVRDVHISHYGRVCPIETPEGTNIGLIVSLGIFSKVDEYGFLITPYRKVKNGKLLSVNEANVERSKADVKKDKKAEKSITDWMHENLECAQVIIDFTSDEISEFHNILSQSLSTKKKEETTQKSLLSYIEDRVMIEFPNKSNPKYPIAPYFNRQLPKDDPKKIKEVWKTKVPEKLNSWLSNVLGNIKSGSIQWFAGHEKATKNKAGLYLFKKSGSAKIEYVGIAGKSLYTRLKDHWGGNNVEGSGLRWHIWKNVLSKEPNIVYLRADEEMKAIFAPPSMVDPATNNLRKGLLLARRQGDLAQATADEVDYVDISPKQTVGVSASLIPFLEHDDANRALMGSNMMRQSVPLLKTEPPLVGTGMEESVARNSSMLVRAESGGVVTSIDSQHITINDTDEYILSKFHGLNERTCLNQQPTVKLGDTVEAGQIIADGGGTCDGVLSLGKNLLVAFVTFDGYNFEDAMLISQRLVKDDVFTSIHIDEFTVDVRETKLGREEFTRDIPNVSEKMLRNLDETGVIREGTRVSQGDILVGKVSPKSKTELTPEEKLLHAIFGRAGEDVKNDSLEVPSGYEGVVINTSRFMRRGSASDEQKTVLKDKMRQYEDDMDAKQCLVFRKMIAEIHDDLGIEIVDPTSLQKAGVSDDNDVIYEQVENFDISWVKPAKNRGEVQVVVDKYWPKIISLQKECKQALARMKHGDELPSGVLEMVKIYVATKRTLSVGDKMAGRHGNKGVIAKIMPIEDMPFLEDGTPVDICLNPLGVPSRMNVGQILETLLGWSANTLGFRSYTPVFDGATEEEILEVTQEANKHVADRMAKLEKDKQTPPCDEMFVNMPERLSITLYDGRTGEALEQSATVGYMYMMKLHHLVDEKIHARATGPYSLITQQPLGGKARTGGQRFGEMEVWALEAYGAAYTLQELLTVKSDDIEGRTKIYESMVKGTNTLEAGTPISFDVLCNEIRGLGLNIQLEKKRVGAAKL